MAKVLINSIVNELEEFIEHYGSMPIVIGIDPGKHGAFAIIDAYSNKCYATLKMPCYKNEIDWNVVLHILSNLKAQTLALGVEDIHPRPSRNRGAASQGKFLKQAGMLEGIIFAIGFTTYKYNPLSWKKKYGLSISKAEKAALGIKTDAQKTKELKRRAIEKAENVLSKWEWPEYKITDGQAEAFLVATMARTDLMTAQEGDTLD